jgi:hypothetical protein
MRGKIERKKEPTDTTTINVAQLVKKSIRSPFDVHGRRMNKRLLLCLVHPQN